MFKTSKFSKRPERHQIVRAQAGILEISSRVDLDLKLVNSHFFSSVPGGNFPRIWAVSKEPVRTWARAAVDFRGVAR